MGPVDMGIQTERQVEWKVQSEKISKIATSDKGFDGEEILGYGNLIRNEGGES